MESGSQIFQIISCAEVAIYLVNVLLRIAMVRPGIVVNLLGNGRDPNCIEAHSLINKRQSIKTRPQIRERQISYLDIV